MQIDGGQMLMLGLAGGGGLLVKIVYDWLKNGRKNGNGINGINALVEACKAMAHNMSEIRKDTYTTRDDVKVLSTKYTSDIADFKQVVQQSMVINTKMVVLLENINTMLTNK